MKTKLASNESFQIEKSDGTVIDVVASLNYLNNTIEDNEKVVATALNYLNNTIEDNEKVVATALNYLNKVIEAHTVVSAVTVNTNLSNVTCPTSITGSSNNGAQATVIYENEGSTNDYTVSVSTSYNTPDGSQLVLTCPKNGYCEVNYLNVNGKIYARGV